ncbi:MAG: transposase [Flavobacteriaceae bacterium]|nr:transposase [Flavobacteriaceae bacterium]
MNRKNRLYTREFKEEAIKLALDSPSVSGAAKELGIPEPTLHSWVSKAKSSGQHLITQTDGSVNHVDVSAVIAENRELKKRLARLEQEKSILKKAATYFAKELE